MANSVGIALDPKALADLTTAINNLTSSFDKLEKQLVDLSKRSTLQEVFGTNAQFDKFIKSLNTLSREGQEAFTTFSKSFKELFDTFKSIDSKILENLVELFPRLERIFTTLTKADLPKAAKDLTDAFKQLAVGLKAISTVTSFIPGDRQLKLLSQSIDTISLALRRLVTLNEDLSKDKDTFKRIATFFTQLTAAFKIVAALTNVLPGGNAIDNLSKSFQRIGIGLAGIDRFTKNLNFNSILKVAGALSGIAISLRGAAALAGNSDKVKAFAELISAVGGLFRALNTSSGDDEVNEKRTQSFKRNLENLKSALQSIAGLKIDSSKLQVIQSLTGQKSGTSSNNVFSSVLPDIERFALRLISLREIVDVVQRAFRAFFEFIDFVNPLSAIQRFANSAGEAFRNLGQELDQLGQDFIDFGQNILDNAGFNALFNSEAFQGTINFDDAINQLRVFGDLTEEELETAIAFAEEIGIQYPLSSAEAVTALTDLRKAGLDLNDAFDALPAAADLAVFTQSGDIQESARALIGATSAFDEFSEGVEGSFENISTASDVFVRVANSTTAEVDDLIAGLENVGPAANSFGLNLEETVSILGIFNDAGIRGAEAGTALRSTLNALQSDRAQDELRRLGISLFDAQGNMRSLNDVLTDLNARLFETRTVQVNVSNITAEQRAQLDAAQRAYARAQQQLFLYNEGLARGALDAENAAQAIADYTTIANNAQQTIADITGSQEQANFITQELTASQQEANQSLLQLADTFGRQGLLILLDQGANGIDNFVNAMDGLPTAAEQAQLLIDSLRGDLEQLSGSFETFKDRVLLPLISRAFRPFIQLLLGVVNGLLEAGPELTNFLSSAIFLFTSLATAVGSLSVVTGVILRFGGAVSTAIGFLLPLVTTPGLIVAGIAAFTASLVALTAAITVLTPLFLAISAIVEDFFIIIENNIGGARDSLIRFGRSFQNIFFAVGRIAQQISRIFNSIFGQSSEDNLLQFGTTLSNIFTIGARALTAFALGLNQVGDILEAFANGLDANNLESIRAFFAETDRLARNPFIQSLLGEGTTGEDVRVFFNSIKDGLRVVSLAVENATTAFTDLFTFGINDTTLQNLDRALGEVGIQILNNVDRIFGTNFRLIIGNALLEGGGLTDLFESFVQEGIFALGQAILDNEDTVKNALISIFEFLLPGKIFVPILDALGFDQLADGLQSVFDLITGAFSGFLDVVFRLARGESLQDIIIGSLGADGPKVIKIFTQLGRALKAIGAIFGDVISILFPEGINIDTGGIIGNALDTIGTIAETVADILEAVRPTIRSITILFVNLGTELLRFIELVGNPFEEFLDSLFSGEFENLGDFAIGLAQALGDTLRLAIAELPRLLGDILIAWGSFFQNDFLNSLGILIREGNFGEAIRLIAEGIWGIIIQALDILPEFFIELGDALGIPLISAIGEFLADLDLANILANGFEGNLLLISTDALNTIAETIANVISQAILLVPTILKNLGGLLGIQSLIDLGSATEGSTLIEVIAEALGNIVTYPLELVSSFLRGVGTLVDTIAKAGILGVTVITGVLGAIGGFVALQNLPTLIPLISGFFTTFGTFLTVTLPAAAASLARFLLPFATFIGALVTLENVFANLDDLARGDVGGFLSDTLLGITEDIAGFIGLEPLLEGIFSIDIDLTAAGLERDLGLLFSRIGLILNFFVRDVVEEIADGARAVVVGALASIDEAKARLQLAISGTDQFGVEFFQVADTLRNNITGLDFFTRINDAIVGATDPESLSRQLIAGYQVVLTRFTEAIQDPSILSDADFTAIANTIVASGQLGDALVLAAQTNGGAALEPFLNALVNVDPSVLRQIDFTQLTTQLTDQIFTGQLSGDAATRFINQLLSNGTITQETADGMLLAINNALNDAQNAANNVNVPVTGEVTDVVVPDPTGAEGEQVTVPVTGELDPANVEVPEDIPEEDRPTVEVNAEVTADIVDTNLATSADAEEYRAALERVQVQADSTNVALNELIGAVVNYNLTLLTQLTLAGVQWMIHSALVNPILENYNTLLSDISTNVVALTDNLINLAEQSEPITIGLTTIGDSFTTFADVAELALDRVVIQLRTLTEALGLYALALVTAGLSDEIPSEFRPDIAGGREFGGSVFADNLYEVNENGKSELFRMGNRTFLLPGQNGRIIPLSNPLMSASPQVNNNQTNMGGVVIQAAPIQISIAQQPGQSASDLANQVGQQVQTGQQTALINVTRDLRLAGRNV